MRLVTLAFKSHLSGATIYTGTVDAESRSGVSYPNPLGSTGRANLQADVKAGLFAITVDNGATIAPGTLPTLTKPAAPSLAAPTGLTATAVSSTQINLAWTAVSGATGYLLERSANGSTGWTQIAAPSTNSYPNTGLTASTAYYYRVRASNSGGPSSYSSTANATTSGSGYGAYSKKLQAEDADSNISFSGTPGDGTTRSYGNNSSHYMQWTIDDAPVSDSLYAVALRYQTTSEDTNSIITLIINGASTTVTLPFTGGGINTFNVTGKALTLGSNTIRIQGSSGNFGMDYIIITHAASS